MFPEYAAPHLVWNGQDAALSVEWFEGIPLVHCILQNPRKGIRELDSVWPWFLQSVYHMGPLYVSAPLLDRKRQKFAERMGFSFLVASHGHVVFELKNEQGIQGCR